MLLKIDFYNIKMTRLSIIYAKTIDGYFSKKEGGLPWPRIS